MKDVYIDGGISVAIRGDGWIRITSRDGFNHVDVIWLELQTLDRLVEHVRLQEPAGR